MSKQRLRSSHSASALFDDVLEQYWPDGEWIVAEGKSGWNNTTRYVQAEGRRWVLRIYETHRDASKVAFEHALLRELKEMALPFDVPCPILARSGSTYVVTRDGTERLACVFPYLEGERPPEKDTQVAAAIGTAAAHLGMALAEVHRVARPQYPPYYELDQAHPLCTPDSVAAFCSAPPEAFAAEAGRLGIIGQALGEIRGPLQRLRGLPHQLIHGDINHSNLLGGQNITAVLDFEFVTWDLRVMELAVVIAGLLSESEGLSDSEDLSLIEAMLRGFGEKRRLSREEAEAIPVLVRLRKLDVFLHFLGRYWDGVDDASVLLAQLHSTERGLQRYKAIEKPIEQMCYNYLTTLMK
ncbi:phosphotransferase [Cohnella panacarvi]|uniref:phosphotransferase n=1 Tax=Cohnella panacarvi TaxID=400776 RepID=UPI00047D2826|nr:phosphotransferase [Cohnella panacarvi]